eukprot:CAMPEP_0194565912 /NCGR_PEP_ID=MMETSP0292-20121207/5006_1 /TAXON_ID=39354 /ORGANISM="Heterosigma akashiwo, Strain CCMP2393" /LENGTH=152 /DNA_ID=CAMNT_0039415393 /DNA_START=143 /DNA_END=598 /DNA_ORIENTATION=+
MARRRSKQQKTRRLNLVYRSILASIILYGNHNYRVNGFVLPHQGAPLLRKQNPHWHKPWSPVNKLGNKRLVAAPLREKSSSERERAHHHVDPSGLTGNGGGVKLVGEPPAQAREPPHHAGGGSALEGAARWAAEGPQTLVKQMSEQVSRMFG